ncbi:MAG: hydrogenase maturation protease [Candidatus Fermentibacteraceae bacterium]|nr:hydrogenase maturation protease [Candidatus Fermentibacteraceae bacterium]
MLLGLGNPILGDDGVGCSLADLILEMLEPSGDLEILSASVSPVRLVDRIACCSRLIIVDSVSTGRAEPGDLLEIDFKPGEDLPPTSHHFPVHQIPEISRALGLPCPNIIKVYGIEIEPPGEYSDRLSERISRLLPSLAESIIELELTDFNRNDSDDPARGEQAV